MLPIHKLIKEGPALENVLEQLRNRRSVRKYKADMVPQEILDQIIEAGLYAPSGKGQQNTIIIQEIGRAHV